MVAGERLGLLGRFCDASRNFNRSMCRERVAARRFETRPRDFAAATFDFGEEKRAVIRAGGFVGGLRVVGRWRIS